MYLHSRYNKAEDPFSAPEQIGAIFSPQSKLSFFTLWKDADPDMPIPKEARAQYAKLQ
jgi:hypothetical protein